MHQRSQSQSVPKDLLYLYAKLRLDLWIVHQPRHLLLLPKQSMLWNKHMFCCLQGLYINLLIQIQIQIHRHYLQYHFHRSRRNPLLHL